MMPLRRSIENSAIFKSHSARPIIDTPTMPPLHCGHYTASKCVSRSEVQYRSLDQYADAFVSDDLYSSGQWSVRSDMKRWLIISSFMLVSSSNVHALECQRELPKYRQGHWAYRIIDGRTCWYEGKRMLSKSLLRWRADARVPKPAPRPEPMTSTTVKLGDDPEPHSCCWPPLDIVESFESRWQGLQFTPESN